MVERFHALANQIFDKQSLDDLDLTELKSFTDQNPYFAPAQFLLLEKLRLLNSPDYGPQLQKAVLYYNDPLSFEYFINNKWAELERFETEYFQNDDLIDNEPADTERATPNVPTEDIGELELTVHEKVETVEATSDDLQEENSVDSDIVEDESRSQTEPPVAEESATDNSSIEEVRLPSPAVESQADELSFEPYHTVDYFASQGIRLNIEEQPKDRFGKQLKSFTEWLKTMKRLPGQPVVKDEPVTDVRVDTMAQSSVDDPEVVTESMAEVWLKQGNSEKALEVYEKLALNNPSKSVYFATLINNLKKS